MMTPNFILACALVMPAQTAERDIPGYTGEAKAVFDRSCELYHSARTYQDRITFSYEYDADGDVEKLPSMQRDPVELYFERPGRFAAISADTGFVSDGTVLWHYNQTLQQYTEEPAPEVLSCDPDDSESLYSRGLYHPVFPALVEPVEKRFEHIRSFGQVRPEERSGRPGRWLELVIEGTVRPEPLELMIWCDDETGRIEELVYDYTSRFAASAEYYQEEYQVTIHQARMRVVVEDIRIDEALPAERFTFEPSPELQKVDRIQHDRRGSRRNQLALIGKPAPAIEGDYLDGRQVEPEDLAGKVVLLDFWATWCGPCVAALPEVEELYQLFKDKPVVVLGVNQDAAGSTERVHRFLEEKSVTYPQIHDPQGDLGRRFHVSGIPCIVLIDANGVLQYIKSGYERGMAGDLTEKLEKLLRGEQIYDPQEIETELARLAAEQQTTSRRHDIEEFEPHRLPRPRTIARWTTGWKSRVIDIDRDGMPELVLPGYGGKLLVYRPGMSSPEEIVLEGLGSSCYLKAFAPVAVEEETCWSVAAYVTRGLFRRRHLLQVSLHDPAGKLIWKHELEVPRHSHSDVSLDAGDLNGNGTFEIAFVWQDDPQLLFVLDGNGSLISRRRPPGRAGGVRILPASPDHPGEVIVLDERGTAAAYILLEDELQSVSQE